jgi:uncharacterized protein DUF4926
MIKPQQNPKADDPFVNPWVSDRIRRCILSDKKRLVTGEVGAVVEVLAADAFEVEFCDEHGRTYGLHTLRSNQIVPLRTQGNPLRVPLKAA